jgi:predicted N-formylglutamate amidohydrolase
MQAPSPPLLEDDEPPPVRVLRADGRADFLLTADHAGQLIPRRLGTLGLPAAERLRHIAWDIGIGSVTEMLSVHLDATAVLQNYSRLVVDCNRREGHPTSMPEISENAAIPGNQGLAPGDIEARYREVFRPYHACIAGILDARLVAGQRTIVIAMHSFTPVFRGETREMQVGVLYNRDRRLASIMLDLLRAEGDISVGDNAPYAITADSDYTIPFHAERRGLAHVEIELRQDLLADAPGRRAWAARLSRLMRAADTRLRRLGV